MKFDPYATINLVKQLHRTELDDRPVARWKFVERASDGKFSYQDRAGARRLLRKHGPGVIDRFERPSAPEARKLAGQVQELNTRVDAHIRRQGFWETVSATIFDIIFY